MVAYLFLGCQVNTWFLFPTLCNGQECSAPEDAFDKDEEEEEDEEEEGEEEEEEEEEEE